MKQLVNSLNNFFKKKKMSLDFNQELLESYR